jgi:hypothetical protein
MGVVHCVPRIDQWICASLSLWNTTRVRAIVATNSALQKILRQSQVLSRQLTAPFPSLDLPVDIDRGKFGLPGRPANTQMSSLTLFLIGTTVSRVLRHTRASFMP